jgi:hypothetical protein
MMSQLGTERPSWLRKYICRPASMYDTASLKYRWPSRSTMIDPGLLRSPMCIAGTPPGFIDAGIHHASSIRSTAAPCAIASSITSPVSPGLATVQSAVFGWREYVARIALLRANPPEPKSTPRRAPIRTVRP